MMIVDKRPLPDDPTPSDAPPSYDALQGEKSGFGSDTKTQIQTSLPSPPPQSPPVEFLKKDKGKSRPVSNTWFIFNTPSSSRTVHEIRNTVQGLLRDLVQDQDSDSPAVGILNSCADACEANHVSFSDILQQRYIEEHTPLYWAIVKRLPDHHPDVDENQGPDLLTALVSYASPLKEATITEIRQACLATSDQNLFKRLGKFPGFARMSAVDQMLLGVKIPPDDIEVEENEGAFGVNFVIHQFHKRMAISKQIPLEFIARGRLWRFAFLVAPESAHSGSPPTGSWCISLSLQECSPPTHVDSRLLIFEAPPSSVSQSKSPPASASISPSRLNSIRQSKSNAVVIVHLQTDYHPLEAPGKHSEGRRILKPLAANLQYPNNPYIDSDERLRARLEARLGRSDKDCVIC